MVVAGAVVVVVVVAVTIVVVVCGGVVWWSVTVFFFLAGRGGQGKGAGSYCLCRCCNAFLLLDPYKGEGCCCRRRRSVRVSLRQWTYVGNDCVAGGDQERFKLNSVLLLCCVLIASWFFFFFTHYERRFWIFRVHDETTTISRAPSWIDIRKQPNRWSFALCSS